jgi:hypothetical protein
MNVPFLKRKYCSSSALLDNLLSQGPAYFTVGLIIIFKYFRLGARNLITERTEKQNKCEAQQCSFLIKQT